MVTAGGQIRKQVLADHCRKKKFVNEKKIGGYPIFSYAGAEGWN